MSKDLKNMAGLGVLAGTAFLVVKAVTVGIPMLNAKSDFEAVNSDHVKFTTVDAPVFTDEKYAQYLEDLCGSDIAADSVACKFEAAQFHAETHGKAVTLTYTICPTEDAIYQLKESAQRYEPVCN